MAKSYYYLVSGLPEIALDVPAKGVSLLSFMDEALEIIPGKDADNFKLLRYVYDNKNLINIIENKGRDFDGKGFFSEEQLVAEIKNIDSVPLYMQTFLEARKTNTRLYPELTLEDELNSLFLKEALSSENSFLKEYFLFEVNLRNVLTGLNYRRYGEKMKTGGNEFSLENVLIPVGSVFEQVAKSSAPDFGLSSEYPWVSKVISFEPSDVLTFEKSIDQLRWELLDEMTLFSYFQIETVLAFLVKLSILERWSLLTEDIGKENFSTIVSNLKTNFKFEEEL